MSKWHIILRTFSLLFIFAVSIATSSPAFASSLSTTTLITAGTSGHGANDYVQPPAASGISNDGRITVFSSSATDIIPNDTNEMYDVFAYDRITKKTELISHTATGRLANYSSYNPTISGDGRYVAYMTMASDIVPDTAAFCGGVSICPNVVVYDRVTKTAVFANRTAQGKRISNDIQTIGDDPPIISSNGRFVAYRSPDVIDPNDANDNYDIFVYDLQTHITRVASVDSSGHTSQYDSWDGSISGDGRIVVFNTSSALVPEDINNDYDSYAHDMQTGRTTLLSVAQDGHAGNGSSFDPVVSSDGYSAVFVSDANNLVMSDTNDATDTFLRDLRTGKTKRVSVSSKAIQANGRNSNPAISGDGRFVAFSSWANNLVSNDTNGMQDIFLYDSSIGLTRRITRASHDGEPAKGGSLGTWQPISMSGDGKAITFTSDAVNLASTNLASSTPNMYLNYNPVVAIPFYDGYGFLELL